jgi:hypothetical protein
MWSIDGTALTGENQMTRRKTCRRATSFITNPTWTALGTNLRVCVGNLTNNCLRYGMVWKRDEVLKHSWRLSGFKCFDKFRHLSVTHDRVERFDSKNVVINLKDKDLHTVMVSALNKGLYQFTELQSQLPEVELMVVEGNTISLTRDRGGDVTKCLSH